MISDKMSAALNRQINMELSAGYVYMAMSAWAASVGLKGAASWFWVQTQEEMTHVMRFRHYLESRGSQVLLDTIAKPQTDYKNLLDAFEAALGHEQKVTASIDALVDLAREEKDHASDVFLQWFVAEQVEEEESAQEQIDRVKLAGESGGGLFMIDRELGARVFTMPADLAAGA